MTEILRCRNHPDSELNFQKMLEHYAGSFVEIFRGPGYHDCHDFDIEGEPYCWITVSSYDLRDKKLPNGICQIIKYDKAKQVKAWVESVSG